jgi:DNA-directed RNA polymerase specialized sigma24 family protein
MPIASPDTSLSLLEQLREGDAAAAWNRLVSLYTSLLQTWFRAAGLQPADRDDLTQRVLEVLFRQLPRFKYNGRPGAFRAWLRGITVDLLREHWRRRATPDSTSVLDTTVNAVLIAKSRVLARLREEARGLIDQGGGNPYFFPKGRPHRPTNR